MIAVMGSFIDDELLSVSSTGDTLLTIEEATFGGMMIFVE